MSDELRHSWTNLARGAVVTLAAWSLVDAAVRSESADDGARPVRRAAPGPLPLAWPDQPVIVPRAPVEAPQPEARRADAAATTAAKRPARDSRALRPDALRVTDERRTRSARLLLLVAPKHGPPTLA
ncbi:MAG: hypothetical protein JXB32_16295 [Deltaproteobacteria bacterium]|nr:hypothetical protein [Deltaproteobacteria bacterium]